MTGTRLLGDRLPVLQSLPERIEPIGESGTYDSPGSDTTPEKVLLRFFGELMSRGFTLMTEVRLALLPLRSFTPSRASGEMPEPEPMSGNRPSRLNVRIGLGERDFWQTGRESRQFVHGSYISWGSHK